LPHRIHLPFETACFLNPHVCHVFFDLTNDSSPCVRITNVEINVSKGNDTTLVSIFQREGSGSGRQLSSVAPRPGPIRWMTSPQP